MKIDMSDFSKKLNKLVNNQVFSKDYVEKVSDKLKGQPNISVNNLGASADISIRLKKKQKNTQAINFLDLKPRFQASSKAKAKKDGGWYLRVPIGLKTKEFRPLMSSKDYQSLTHLNFGDTGQVSGLQKLQQDISKTIPELRYQWKSNNVTRTQNGNRGKYIAFRTVSDKSDPSSWIMNRNEQTEENTSPELREQINKLLKADLMAQLKRM